MPKRFMTSLGGLAAAFAIMWGVSFLYAAGGRVDNPKMRPAFARTPHAWADVTRPRAADGCNATHISDCSPGDPSLPTGRTIVRKASANPAQPPSGLQGNTGNGGAGRR